MNLLKLFLRRAPVAFALSAGFLLIPAGRSQPAPQMAESRYLFIFDTSANMKNRLPAVQLEVNELLSTGMDGQLRPGDSLGIWTFDQNLHAGQFPLQYWKPEGAVTIASGINKFIGKQRYANRTRFNALQPQLNQVIRDSERLTVLIFCDGDDEINWTPYNAGINQVFQQRLAGQQKTRQPFVLVFRTQAGQYAGCSMNFPPGMVSVPEFPPLPAPPVPVKAPPSAPPTAPAVKPPPTGPPLIIIGTKVETNRPPASAPPPAANPVPEAPASVVPATPAIETNAAPAPPPNVSAPANPAPVTPTNLVSISESKPIPSTNAVAPPPPTNVVPAAPANPVAPKNPVSPQPPPNPAPAIETNAAPAPPSNVVAPANATRVTPIKPVHIPPSKPIPSTNAAAPPLENTGTNHGGALVIGVTLLVAAGGLVALAVFRGRRPSRGSLISRSMRKD